jgi:hypothetical protein
MDQSAVSSEAGPGILSRLKTRDGPWPRFHDVYKAYKAARVGKPASSHQIRFQSMEAIELVSLHRDIHAGRYQPQSFGKSLKCEVALESLQTLRPKKSFQAESIF